MEDKVGLESSPSPSSTKGHEDKPRRARRGNLASSTEQVDRSRSSDLIVPKDEQPLEQTQSKRRTKQPQSGGANSDSSAKQVVVAEEQTEKRTRRQSKATVEQESTLLEETLASLSGMQPVCALMEGRAPPASRMPTRTN